MEKSKVIQFVFIALIGIICIVILSLAVAILVKVYKKDDSSESSTTTTKTTTVASLGSTSLSTNSMGTVNGMPTTTSNPSSTGLSSTITNPAVTSAISSSITLPPTTSDIFTASPSPKCPNPQKSTLPSASLPGAYDTLSWGTFRAPLYFGLRMRHPDSPLFGLMWFRQTTTAHNLVLKHYCEDDGVRCMWSDADGETFGSQPIVDINNKDKNKATLFSTDWIRVNRSWEAQISVVTNETVAFIFYFTNQDTVSNLNASYSSKTLSSINGNFGPLGNFQLSFSSTGKIFNDASLVINIEPMLDAGIVNELILSSFLPCKDASSNICIDNGGRPPDLKPNFAAIQFTVN
uniref:Mannosyl-oligosaccharide glucosidase n=1 Tax=Panagrolaimus sp. ES5 TaxID=591445 RepID=A0AC34FYZ9_9BILA